MSRFTLIVLSVLLCYTTRGIAQLSSSCSSTGIASSNRLPVNSTWYSTQCGGGVFDFTHINTQISIQQTYADYSIFPSPVFAAGICTPVIASICDGIKPTSLCSFTWPPSTFESLGFWNTSLPHLYTITSQGVDVLVSEANSCNVSRQEPKPSRNLHYRLICTSNPDPYPLFVVTRPDQCNTEIVIYTSSVCNQVFPTPHSNPCGVGEYNFTSLSHEDLSWTNPFQTSTKMILRPCGVVSTDALGICNQAGASLCISSSDPYVTSPVITINEINPPIWKVLPYGVQMIQQSSTACPYNPGTQLTAKILYICDTNATRPELLEFYTEYQCTYNAVVGTSLICATINPSFPTNNTKQCGGAGFNLTSISHQDLPLNIFVYQTFSYQTLVLRPCGVVSTDVTGKCQQLGASLCIKGRWRNETYAVSLFNDVEEPTWQALPNGVMMTQLSSTACSAANMPTLLTISYICNETATAPVFVSYSQVSPCRPVAVVETSAACDRSNRISSTGSQMFVSSSSRTNLSISSSTGGSGATPHVTCGSEGFDLSPLVGHDLSFTAGVYTYYFSPCGIVSNSSITGAACNWAGAMLCQVNTELWVIATPDDPIWSRMTYGLQVVASGQWCAAISARRTTTIRYFCMPSATNAYIGSLSEMYTCSYVMDVYTNLACTDALSSTGSQMLLSSSSSSGSNSNSTTAVPSSGSQWIGSTGNNNGSPVCSGAGVDLSAIAMYEFRWVYDEWIYYVHPCGAVTSEARCTRLGASVCQVHQFNNDVFALARQSGLWSVVEQSVTISFSDGDYCNAVNDNRHTDTRYVCGSSTSILSITETSTCRYLALIQTPSACSIPLTNNTYTDGSFLSTKCGGGLFNLSSLLTTDLLLSDNYMLHSIRPCGTVSFCPGGLPTSFCTRDDRWSTPHTIPWNAAVPNRYNATRYGVDMIVPNYQSPTNCTTVFKFVCSPSALAPQFVLARSQGCQWTAVILTSAVCLPSTQPVLVQSCGGGGYNFSTISDIEFYWTSAGYSYYLHPCGEISDMFYMENKNYCSGSMFCRTSFDSANYTSTKLAIWDQATITWVPSVLPGVLSVTQYVVSKQQCSSSLPYRIAIVFKCDQYYTSTPLISAVTSEACTTTAYILTSQACRKSISLQPIVDRNCGGSSVDFSDAGDLIWEDTDYVFYLNLCRPVTSAACLSLTPTALCIIYKPTRVPNQLVRYNSTSTYMWHNKASVTMSIQSVFGSEMPKAVSIVISCTNSTTDISTGITSFISVSSSEWLVGADIVCGNRYSSSSSTGLSFSSSASSITSSSSSSFILPSAPYFCGGAGYNVTEASASDLSLTKAQVNFRLRPCGSVTVAGCAGSMLCQISGSTSLGLAYNDSSVSQNWLALPNGVQLTSVNTATGVSCPNSFQTVVISFICNSTVVAAALVDLKEVEQCMYVATVHTSSACQSVGPTVSNEVGVSFYSNRCGGGYYSLSSLVGHDFSFVDTSSSQMYFLRVCDQTSSLSCASVHPTSFCTVRPSSVAATSLATWSNNVASLYTITPSGLDITVSTPGGCGSLSGYAVYRLVCNPLADAAILISVTRVAPLALDCRAIATIHTSSVCIRHNETLPIIDVISSSSTARGEPTQGDELSGASSLSSVSVLFCSLFVALSLLIV